MAGVAHTPHLERRPSGFFFRRRIPSRLAEIPHHKHASALCLSLRTDVLPDAKLRARALTALTDLGFALTTERPVQHLNPQSMTLLSELARFQIAAHEAQRACAEPRSEEAARFAAEVERSTQDMLRRALALGDRAPAIDPLREMAGRFSVSLDESTAEWRALSFEALRVMLDASWERERRELGHYDDVTPVFRAAMSPRSDAPRDVMAVTAIASSPASLTIPAAKAPVDACSAMPMTASSGNGSTPAQTIAQPVHRDAAEGRGVPDEDTLAEPPSTLASPTGNNGATKNDLGEETAFRIKIRPPRLRNIDLRDLTPEMRQVLLEKPRGITLQEGLELMWQLKCAGYGHDFSIQQTGDAAAGKNWKNGSASKANFAKKFWGEFVGDVPFEDAAEDDIRDALKLLPHLPFQHSKGNDKFVARNGFQALVENLDAEEERAEKIALRALEMRGGATEADREKASLDARVPRLRAETRAKHRGYIKSVGQMLYDLQLIDRNPFEICGVPNKLKDRWKKEEALRKRVCWDDRINILFASTAFQGPFEDPGAPLYWIPLIARLMGLREEEACQLGPGDFGTDKGIAYLEIRSLDGNKVKTLDSQRRLPVHPLLLELGLLDLVDLRRRQGTHRLFPHLTRGKSKGTFSENFSKSFTYYRKTNACYWEGLDLHAMRTSFNSDLMNRDKSDAIRCVLMGHDPVDEGAKSYAQGLTLETLYERICDVKLDVSMIGRPFGDKASASARGKVVGIRSVQS